MDLKYEPNDKHKKPWQPGRKGTLCPHWESLQPEKLLRFESELVGKKRYSVCNGIAFAAQMHHKSIDVEYWHGYPEPWENIPPQLRTRWINENKVTPREIKKFWSLSDARGLEEDE